MKWPEEKVYSLEAVGVIKRKPWKKFQRVPNPALRFIGGKLSTKNPYNKNNKK